MLRWDRHDPEAEGAIVMKAPTKEHIRKYNKKFVVHHLSSSQADLFFSETCPSCR